MMFSEVFRLALASLATNKLRSGLTMLGIAVGVFSVIGVMTVITGLREFPVINASMDENPRAMSLAVSTSMVLLMVIIMRRISSLASTSLTRTSSLSARSLTVMPSARVIVRVTGGGSTGAEIDGPEGRSRRGDTGRIGGRCIADQAADDD